MEAIVERIKPYGVVRVLQVLAVVTQVSKVIVHTVCSFLIHVLRPETLGPESRAFGVVFLPFLLASEHFLLLLLLLLLPPKKQT